MGKFSVCDIGDVKSVGMQKAQAKLKELRAAGVPVPSQVYSDILKQSNEEARAECKPADMTATAEQIEKIKAVCSPCAARYTLKEKPAAAPEPEFQFTTKEEVSTVKPAKVTEK